MSRTTYIVCKTCKEYLWIGQSSIIYTGEPETMKQFSDFLQEHITYSPPEHELLFMPEPFNGYYENEDWEDVTDRDLAPKQEEKSESTPCEHEWYTPDFGDPQANELGTVCKKCDIWKVEE